MRDDLKILLEKNLAISEETYRLTKKINKYIVFSQVIGVIKIILIVAPIIWAIIYLPPILKNLLAPYQNLMPQGLRVDQLNFSDLSEYLKNPPKVNQ